VATAFGLRRRAVTLVAGATSRTKILEVEGAEPATLTRLLAGADATPLPTAVDRSSVLVGMTTKTDERS
jgi:hypothetical protein